MDDVMMPFGVEQSRVRDHLADHTNPRVLVLTILVPAGGLGKSLSVSTVLTQTLNLGLGMSHASGMTQ